MDVKFAFAYKVVGRNIKYEDLPKQLTGVEYDEH